MQNYFAQTCPILPNGAHLYTALVLFHRSSAQRCKSYSRQQLYGQRSSSRVNWLGIGADQISRSYFGGSVSAREVLVRHTVFGYYALGLSEQRASDWASSLALGQAQRATRYIRNATGAIVSGACAAARWRAGRNATEVCWVRSTFLGPSSVASQYSISVPSGRSRQWRVRMKPWSSVGARAEDIRWSGRH